MEFPNEKISFEKRNSAAFDNRAYNEEFPLPTGICGRRYHSHGYIQPYNWIGESISSNHDYLIVQGSIRSNSQVKIADEFPEHIMYDGETRLHYKNKREFNHDFDDIRIYSEIGDFTKLNTTEQSDVKGFDQREYVQRLSNNYCEKKDKETNQALKNSSCSPCKIVILITIITILLTLLGFGLYFLILRNISEEEKNTTLEAVISTSIKTMQMPTTLSSTFVTTIGSTKASTDTFTNPASKLITSTDQDISSAKESYPSVAPSSTTQFYCFPTGKTILQLNPHQRADLEDNRNSLLHSCEADVGFPAGNLSIEIMKSGELEFRKLNVATISTEDSKTSCEIHRKINFGIVFSSDMDKAIIRCKVIHNYFQDSPAFYSNNETVSLIPGDICRDNTVSESNRAHPTNCHHYIRCQNKIPYGQACQYNYCFGIYTLETCSPCSDVTCRATSISCTNTTIVQQQSKVSMTLHSDQIAGLTSPRAAHLHTCTGFIGNLTGEISVEVQLEGNDNYQTISPSYTTETDTTENCGITRVFKFWIGFTVAMYNANIRCKVTNGLYPDVSPKYSSSETLYLVSSEFCNQNFEGTITNKHHHPTTCHRYVTCEDKGPSVQACPSSLCFSLEKDYCDFCAQVKTCL